MVQGVKERETDVEKRSTKFVVEVDPVVGFVPDTIPERVSLTAAQRLGSRQQVEDELDELTEIIRKFWGEEPDFVMRSSSAISARLTELSILLHRAEVKDRQFKQVRTMQVDRLLSELDRQFKVHSRMVELRRQDIEISK